MLDLDPFAPLEDVTQGFSKPLHRAATNAFPHTAPKLGRAIQNNWARASSSSNSSRDVCWCYMLDFMRAAKH